MTRSEKTGFAIAFLLIVLVAAGPVIGALLAGLVAEANGCVLNEGDAHPCLILGMDVGPTLYTLFVLAWFGMMTLPLGAIALVVWFVALIAVWWRSRGKPAA